METKALSRNVSVNRSVKVLTDAETEETPEWIKDLCNYWLQVISHFRKDGSDYKFYIHKITGLLHVISPSCIMGVKTWIFQPGTKPAFRWRILKTDIEGILKLIRILNSSKNAIYIRAVKELESLLVELTDPLLFTQEGAVHQE